MSSLMTKLQRNSARNWSITCGPFYFFSQLFALGGSKRVTKGPQRFTPLRAKFVSDKGNREPTCSSFLTRLGDSWSWTLGQCRFWEFGENVGPDLSWGRGGDGVRSGPHSLGEQRVERLRLSHTYLNQ